MNGNVYIPYQRFRDLSPACEACAAYWPHILALSAVSLLATPLALLAPVTLQVARGQYSRLPPLRSFITCFYPIDRGPTAFWRSRRGSFQLAFALLDEVPDVTEKPAARPIARAARSNSAEARSHIRMDRRCIGILSFHIRAGSRIGVAGVTGAGKNHVG